MTPNPSLEPTRYGKQRKAGLRYSVHFLIPALRRSPPRAAQLELQGLPHLSSGTLP